jgi:hypothetical protein
MGIVAAVFEFVAHVVYSVAPEVFCFLRPESLTTTWVLSVILC